jgi:hypothetical protein
VAGATVSVAGQSLVTSAAGCVYFPAINAGQWPVTVAKPGLPWNYMDSDNQSPGGTTASIVVGDVSTASVSFDEPAQFKPVTFAYEDGTPGAKWTSLTLATQTKTLRYTGTSRTSFDSDVVFPFAAGWAFYAGNCDGNNPAMYASNATSVMANSSIKPDRGATVTSGRAYMRQITLHITDSSISANTPVRYYVRPYTDTTYTQMTGCAEALTPPTPTGSNATIDKTTKAVDVPLDLPYGLYSVCVENTQNPGTTAYRAVKFGSGTAPSGAYSIMPSVTGITLKPTAPVNDSTNPVNLALNTTSGNADLCA